MHPPTTRLYYEDPFLLAFEATVLGHASFQGRPALVLDRSAFYPESGGQLGDTGALGALPVVDVQTEGDVVYHLVADLSLAPPPGATVQGAIDRARRRLHQSLHTGQHMLSRALLDVARAETVSSRLGARACTIDVDAPHLTDGDLARAESSVNAVVEADVAVRAFFPSPEELSKLPLRRAPRVQENIRVVSVEGFDVSPCGGTHCTRSAQVGLVTITSVERYKGKHRVTFLAGRSAVEELTARSQSLASLAREFTCGVTDVGPAVERLRRDLRDTRVALGNARARQMEALAERLLAALPPAPEGAERRVVHTLEGEPVEALRALGARLTAKPGVVALLASRSPEGLTVVMVRSQGATFDCGAWLKRVASACGGRGGGRPDRAEGRLPPDQDLAALAERA